MSKHPYKNNLSQQEDLASVIERNYKEQQFFVSHFFLVLKLCFSFLAIVSLIKLGYSSKVRLTRLREIEDSFLFEQSRFKDLSSRFDELFSFEGEQRFMKDQVQMISRDIIRVICR